MESLSNMVSILGVVFGLGLVIFLHELGHFLLAKWNGVKVEKFSIGFGPTLFGFRKGETEYVIAAVPLGGFVKMLGEGPEEEANKSTDPRAFPNKSVGARMAIISAGVIMNLILGLLCFVYFYGHARNEMPAIIGAVVAGTPAYELGLQPGDEIVALDGRKDLSYFSVKLRVSMSGHKQVLNLDVKRPGHEGVIPLRIEPRRSVNSEAPTIGIVPKVGLEVLPQLYKKPPGVLDSSREPGAGFKDGDILKAAGAVGTEPTPIDDSSEWEQIRTRYADKPIKVVVERKGEPDAQGHTPPPTTAEVVLAPNHFLDFGFRLTPDAIMAIRGGSRAEQAGFRKGDTIVKVDGRDDFDPLRLPTLCYEKAGKPLTFEVSRPEPGGSPRTVTITVTPDDSLPWSLSSSLASALDIPGIGVAFAVRPRIAAVVPGSPADKAGLKPGQVITAIGFPPDVKKPTGIMSQFWAWVGSLLGRKPEDTKVGAGENETDWSTVFIVLQSRPKGPVKLTLDNSSKPVEITPEPDPTWFNPDRGLPFLALIRRMPPLNPAGALSRGYDDTVDNVLMIYAMFRGLVQGRVSTKNLGGPFMIAEAAYRAASSGITELIHFLGILSINLAVLNFLPIPPLDGGQMVFLLAEKVRGRPLPESALAAGTYLGLLLVLSLMAFVIFQDVQRWFS